jgi:DNA recombination protein RmuC
VKPLKESLERMDRQLQTVERVRQESYGALQTQVTTLAERAGSLTNALRTPHVRGRWGEAQLRNVVEYAGMVEYCDYVSQATTASDEGILRPDLVVRIPGGKHVVIDAKAPLVPISTRSRRPTTPSGRSGSRIMLGRCATTSESCRPRATGASSTRRRTFVVMFLPDESYLRAAHEHDPSLQEYAWSSNVIPRVAEHADGAPAHGCDDVAAGDDRGERREVSDLGRELYKRLSTMGTHFAKLGRTLGGAVDAYNQTVGSLETPGASSGAPLRAARDLGDRVAGAAADRSASPGRSPPPSSWARSSRRSKPCRQARRRMTGNIEDHRYVVTSGCPARGCACAAGYALFEEVVSWTYVT